ncbi:phage tail protein, partial [Escherichia coli]|nr:phage tail protein [Escherichia coli]
KYNIVSNVIGEECQHVVYNGTETETAPTNNIISSVMANNPKYAAVVVGKGTGNLISNVLVDYSESDAKQAHGVTVQGNNNIASNILM